MQCTARVKVIRPNTPIIVPTITELIIRTKIPRIIENVIEQRHRIHQHGHRIAMLPPKPLHTLPQPVIEVLVHRLLQPLPRERVLPDPWGALDSRHVQEDQIAGAEVIQALDQLEVARHGRRVQRGVVLAAPLQRPVDVVDAEPDQKQRGRLARGGGVLERPHLVLQRAHARPAAGHQVVRHGRAVERVVPGQRQRRVVVRRQEPHPVLAARQVGAREGRVADWVARARLASRWVEPECCVRVAAWVMLV